MPDFQLVFNISAGAAGFGVLDWIWLAALVLAAIGVVMMAVLITRRMILGRREARRDARCAFLKRQLLVCLENPAAGLDLQAGDEALLIDVALDILRMIRGEDRARLTGLLRHNGIDPAGKRIDRGSLPQRLARVQLMAYFDDRDSLDRLRAALHDPEPAVQLAAIAALGERGQVALLPEIGAVLEEAHFPASLLWADILCAFGDDAVPALLDFAFNRKIDLPIRIAAVAALRPLAGPEIGDRLHKLAIYPDPMMREAVLDTIARIGTHEPDALLTAALEDSDKHVRQAAARTVGALGLQTMPDQLARRLDDPDWQVRFYAAEALYKIGDRGIAMLRAVAGAPDPDSPRAQIARQMLAEKRGAA